MILDLYAGGPSGWSTALGVLGEKALGLEYDAQACATRAAIGHLTLRCDIGSYPLAPFFGKVTGITASPPCQTFSASGKGEGRKHLDRLVAQVLDADWSTEGLDDRTAHVLHTGRWVSTLMPEWVCFEQVRSVQPIWDAYAELLAGWGYSVWTGKLCAADYGTPQTRIRSILVASRAREVARPTPTHAKAGEGGLPDWVSMAEALGWFGTMDRRGPAAMVGFPRRADTPSNEAGGGVVEIDGVAYRARDLWPSDGPAPTVTEKARSWQVYPLLQPGSWADGRCGNRRLYEADEPAPAPQFGHDSAGWKWVPGERPSWVFERPCTTICGDPRISPPGRHDPSQSGSQFGPEPVRLQLWEALTIQDFHPELPVQGPRTAAFLQVGNCIPVRLARAVLATVLGLDDGAIQAHSGRGAVPVGAPRGDGAEVGSPASSGGGSASRRPQPTEQPPRQSRGDDSRTARRTPQRPSRPDQGVRSVRGRLRTSPDEASEVEDLFQAMHGGAPIPDSNRAVPGAGECQAQADLPDVQQGVHGGAAAGNDGEVLLASLCSSGAAPSSVVAGVDPADDRGDVAAAGDGVGSHPRLASHARSSLDRQGAEMDDRHQRDGMARCSPLERAAAADHLRGAEVGDGEADPGAGRGAGVAGEGGAGDVPVEALGPGDGEGDPPGATTDEVDRAGGGPSRDLDSVKGVPASEPVVAAEASTGASTPKDPRPVMHLITSLSVVKGGVAATVGCSAVLPVMPRADLFENASAWYSLTTCLECRARVEHDGAH